MTPTNEQVVSACQRAGIPVRISGRNGWNKLYYGLHAIVATDDEPIGSARFIVAVLGALGALVEVHRNSKAWMVIFARTEGRKGFAENTLTAACMAAIVAAYPEERE